MIFQRWALIDDADEILGVGVQLAAYRFDRRCVKLSNMGFIRWVIQGARYCKVTHDARLGQSIKDVEHGRIRRSQDHPPIRFLMP